MIDISKIMNEESNPIKDEFSEKEMISSCNNIVIPRFFNLHLEPLIETQERYSESTRTNWSKLLSDVNQNKEQLSDIIRGAYGIQKWGWMNSI